MKFIGKDNERSSREVTFPVSIAATQASHTTTVSLAGMNNLQEGDTVFAFLTDDDLSFSISSSGWTEIVSNTTQNSIHLTIAYKTMGATPDTSLVVSTTIDCLVLLAVRGCDPTNAVISSVATAKSTTITPPSVTVSQDNSTSILLCALDDDASYLTAYDIYYWCGAYTSYTSSGSAAMLSRDGVPAGTSAPDDMVWTVSDSIACYQLIVPPIITDTFNSGIFDLSDVYEDEI